MILHLPEPFRYPRDKLLDLMTAIQGTVEAALLNAAIAGPEEVFRQEIRFVVEMMLELHANLTAHDLEELVRLYAGPALEVPTDQRPLPAADQRRLKETCARYVELRDHPLLPPKEANPVLEKAFASLGWKKPSRRLPEDLSPGDIVWALEKVERRLGHFVCKHYALKRVRQLCRTYQQKWALAGALAPLDAGALRAVLDALVGRHLVLRESDGSFSVHPAVRDHFHRLATSSGQGNWHDLIREQLVSLVQRPGARLPEDRVTLDLVEEAIYHTLEAGRTDEALRLYNQVLGGLRHLAWKLGEMARGLRILRGFKPCPDRWALGWYLRALGELKEAYQQNPLPCFRADIRLLQGRLPQVAVEGDQTRTAVAAFLMGQTTDLPPDCLGGVIPRDQVLLYLGRPDRAWRSGVLEPFYEDIGWEGDRARCQLLLAEVARQQGDVGRDRPSLEAATRWILHSGSVEHLCLLHLVQARASRDAGDTETAQRAVAEGLHIARQCGLGLYHIELLCEQAELLLARADAPAAESFAGEALWRASATDCQFRWGEAEARHLLAQALAAQGSFDEARTLFEKTLALRRQIGDPRAARTKQALALLPG
jgi:tetratricopeptide (TPR) repeat protein